MIFDTVTILICAVLAVLALLSSFSDIFFKKVSENEDNKSADEDCPRISVIIVADNNANELKNNLQAFLSQKYAADYEIIVVVDRDEDDTGDVLKTFGNHSNFYATFVPDSSRYMSRRKLAITLGVKAAKYEWILLTDATCHPVSENWISIMAKNCGMGVKMVLGYSNYSEKAGIFKIFSRFHREYTFLYEAASYGAPYGMAGNNLMFRKSMFMDGNGFQGNLKYLRGEYEFLVNKYSGCGVIQIEANPQSYVVEESPTKKEWRSKNVFYCETRRHLSGKLRHRFFFNLDMFSLNSCLFASFATAVYSAMSQRWLLIPVSCITLFLPAIIRTFSARHAMRQFNVVVPLWTVIPLELCLIWQNLKYSIIYRRADKYDFISHKS